VRTFTDWCDPPPGFVEADLVVHSGPSARGSYVQTLVLTDIASAWTECTPLLVREQHLLTAVLERLKAALPFALVGIDTDNDTVKWLRHRCSSRGHRPPDLLCKPDPSPEQRWTSQILWEPLLPGQKKCFYHEHFSSSGRGSCAPKITFAGTCPKQTMVPTGGPSVRTAADTLSRRSPGQGEEK
jgi:hypothetical protein